jgi:uncharacterized surface protein with fasciclin (FAS1) repeats
MEVTFDMNNLKRSLLLVTILLLILVPSALAQDAPADTVPGYVETDSRLDTLAAALKESGLADLLSSGEWTLFAPTDLAFAELGLNPENIAVELSLEELVDLLRYHLMSGDLTTANLKTKLGNVDMGNGRLAGFSFYEDDIYVNDTAKVIDENIDTGNGTVHVVDNVLQRPWPRIEEAAQTVDEALAVISAKVASQMEESVEAVQEVDEQTQAVEEQAQEPEAAAEAPAAPAVPENSVAGVAIADGRFTTVITAAVASGLVDDLSGGEWTAFVPTDEAFAKHGWTADNITSAFSQEELADLLLYHLMKGNNSTAKLKTQLGNVIMANGQQAGLKFYEDNLYVNDNAMVVQENIVTDNGTIHVVDNVILPPWPKE